MAAVAAAAAAGPVLLAAGLALAAAAARVLLLHLSRLPTLAGLLLLQVAAVALVLQQLLQLARLHASPLAMAPKELLLLLLHCGPVHTGKTAAGIQHKHRSQGTCLYYSMRASSHELCPSNRPALWA